VRFCNRFSGKKIELSGMMSSEERTLWLLRKRLKDFDRCVNTEHLFVSFLTITQSDKSVADGYHWISDVMGAMRKKIHRGGSKFYYVAVLEIQPKRYKEKGVLAPHWHIAIATSKLGNLPHAKHDDENGRIKKIRDGSIVTWDWLHDNVKQKFGMYFCCDAYSVNVYDYLGKYLAKGNELFAFRQIVGKKVRVFSASRFLVEYQETLGQAGERKKLIESHPEFEDLYWRREGSRIVARGKEEIKINYWANKFLVKIKYPKIHTISGDWLVVGQDRGL